MSIKTDNGLKVDIDRVYINMAYEGWIIGWPDVPTQEMYILNSTGDMQGHLGSYPAHLIVPKIFFDAENSIDRMPWWRVGVYLTGPEIACKSAGCGSHLIVVFFTDDPFTKGLNAVVEEAIHELDWEQLAENFDL